jgi:site-specific recombinase XerD
MATVHIQRRENREDERKYQIQYKDPITGKTKCYNTYRKKKEAVQAAHYLRMLIDSGRVNEARKKTRKVSLMTFSEVANSQIEIWKKRYEKGELRKNTFEGYKHRINVLNRYFGNRLICEISRRDILEYQDYILEEQSAVTSNRSLFIIKQVLQSGLRLGTIVEDPSAGISQISEKEHERSRYLKHGEINNLVHASMRTRAKYYMPALIYLGIEYGTSRQEALYLKWTDIDFQGQGFIRFKRTKNNMERSFTLMANTREALLSWRNHLELARRRKKVSVIRNDYVFCRLNGEPIRRFDKAWRHACEIAGIEDFHYHDLRHTYCSHLLMSGSSLKDVKEMIGHRDLAMTDRYSHLSMEFKLGVQRKLEKHYCEGFKKDEKGSAGQL